MKNLKVLFLLVILLQLSVINVSAYTIDDYRKALVETAYAYRRKGEYYQYDTMRKRRNLSPEDIIKTQNYGYGVCDAGIAQIYYQTFGFLLPVSNMIDVINYANKINKNDKTNPIIYNDEELLETFQESGKYSASKAKKYWDDLFDNKKIYNDVRAGDIVQYEYSTAKESGTTGHSMMVIEPYTNSDGQNDIKVTSIGGSSYTYHATNASEKMEKYEADGAMKIGSLRNRLTNATNIKRITIIRIIGEKLKYDGTVTRDTSSVNNVNFLKYDKDNKITLKDLQLTSAAKTRLAYPGMYINKIAQVIEKVNEQKNIYTNNKVVDKGGKIKYTILITNNSDKVYKSIKIEEIIPSNVIVDENTIKVKEDTKVKGVHKDGKITWMTDIPKGESRHFSYIVQVASGQIVESKGFVGTSDSSSRIRNATIVHQIGKNLSQANQDKIVEAYNNYQPTKINRTTYISDIYYKALNVNIDFSKFYDKNLATISDKSKSTLVNNGSPTIKINDSAKKMLLYNFYGVEIQKGSEDSNKINWKIAWNSFADFDNNASYSQPEYKERARQVMQGNLSIGDVISFEGNLFLYVKDNKGDYILVGIDNNAKKVIKKGDSLTTFLRDIIGYDFVIMRPSLNTEINIVESTPTSTATVKPTTTATPEPTKSIIIMTGDVNGDGKVGSSDYILIRKHILKNPVLTGSNLKRADINGDGKITSLDYISLKKIIINK